MYICIIPPALTGEESSEDRIYTPPPTQRGWRMEASVSILARSQSQKSLPGVIRPSRNFALKTTHTHTFY